ncbi:MAG: YraN family protein [Paludibacteraceae bacterium]|nr:YraN family protein [Paludibacteraceae bacterium]
MAKHNDFGKEGELLAQNYLRANKYNILHTNWISGKNELDIVATKDNLLVIVEVKSRSSLRFEQPKDAITNAKIKRIVQATNDYIQQFELDQEVRFDVICVVKKSDGDIAIEHIEDAFLAPNEK